MTASVLDTVRKRCWPGGAGGNIWAVLDGASDTRVYWSVRKSHLDSTCLYSGRLPWELELAAPYLTQLECNDRLTEQVIRHGWGNHWGVFFRCDANLEKLRRHLRALLTVYDPGDRRMLFRYYDPRVLRVYLPTCTADELRTFFGPIEVFWAESDNTSQMLEFAFDGERLEQKTIRLESQPHSS